MANLLDKRLEKPFTPEKSPEQIKRMFADLGYDSVSANIVERLSLLSSRTEGKNTHFRDSMEIAEIVGDLPIEDIEKGRKNEISAAGLAHDIGKTGPECATVEEQQAFVEAFSFRFKKDFYDGVPCRELPLKEALLIKVEEGTFSRERALEIVELITNASLRQGEIKIDETTPIYTLFGAHAYWGYDNIRHENLPESIKNIVASHHLLEGRNPAGIDLDNVDPAIVFVELIDKYQAARVRNLDGGAKALNKDYVPLTHEEVIESCKKRIQKALADRPSAMMKYLDVLEVIDSDNKFYEQELSVTA